ncbi:hypothetical protein GQ44DRAFT_772056 [Phaeosphaeriaceae sp. PMI808]|nr:hypothetical protein GQ44DRAFT_772056 [Phaeosphaeriaceae sp. PMI808]
MPTLVHLVPRVLEAGETAGISPTAIGLIVGVGIIPVFILFYVVSWLFWCYPYDRTCCCRRRKKKVADMENGMPLNREAIREKAGFDIPGRPLNNDRSASGTPNGGSRFAKADPRFSAQTIGSNNIQYAQEPKRFV